MKILPLNVAMKVADEGMMMVIDGRLHYYHSHSADDYYTVDFDLDALTHHSFHCKLYRTIDT
jgi:hypothetical protein